MSLFAGVYALDPALPIDPGMPKLLKGAISRTPGNVKVFSTDCFCVAKFDFGLFGESAYHDDEAAVSALSGEPYMERPDSPSPYSRMSDLLILEKAMAAGNGDILRSCHGVYSLIYYNKPGHSLFLSTDKLGVRPVYYCCDGNYLYFASALRILESIAAVPKRLNLRALVEEDVFGVPLGTKTKYCDVHILRDGQYLQCGRKDRAPKVDYYFRWSRIAPEDCDLDSLRKDCYRAFTTAVKCRSKPGRRAIAMLSGGLDSRCVVTALKALGKELTVLNFSNPGSKDEVYAARYADAIGADLISRHRPVESWWSWGGLTSEALDQIPAQARTGAGYPRLVFSGDGGSVGVGHEYLDDDIFRLLAKNETEAACSHFLKHRRVPRKIITKRLKAAIESVPYHGLKQEMADLANVPPPRAFYLFLLRNDQRRHLHGFYEDLDLHRLELLLPFYDDRLLAKIVSGQVEPFLKHHFYHKWLELFPEIITRVPWQTYPGHAPCPVPDTEPQLTQWELAPAYETRRDRLRMKTCLISITKRDFPAGILRRRWILVALLLHALGLRSFSSLFHFSIRVYEDYRRCKGYSLDCIN